MWSRKKVGGGSYGPLEEVEGKIDEIGDIYDRSLYRDNSIEAEMNAFEKEVGAPGINMDNASPDEMLNYLEKRGKFPGENLKYIE